jgi:hypothetical protein
VLFASPLGRLALFVNSLAGAVIVRQPPSAAFCHADRPLSAAILVVGHAGK